MDDIKIQQTKDLEAIARSVTYRPESRMFEFRALSLSERSAVFNMLSAQLRQVVLKELSFNEALELLDHMDPQRVHQILSKMRDKKRRERLITRFKSDRYEKTDYFLSFHPQATFALVHLNYVYLPDTTTVGDTANIIEDHLKQTGKIPAILVHDEGNLAGEVSLGMLVKERNTSKLKNLIRPIRHIPYNSPRDKILSLFLSSAHEKIAITDVDGSVLGIVYSDDVADLLDSQPAASLYSFAGVEASERPFDGVLDKVKGRYRWLIVNLATCFIAGGVVAFFQGTIDQIVALAIFMPIVAGMGGNAATQTLAIMIRGIAVGEIDLRSSRQAVIREVLAGLVNGVLTGLVLIPLALILGLSLWVAIIAGMAVIFTIVVASFFGAIVPLVLRHFGQDPATSSGIIISTATDVLGLMFFLGMATLFLV